MVENQLTQPKQWTQDWNKRFVEGDTPWEDTEPSPEMMQLFTHFVQPGKSVLEIGCGLGTNAVWLAQQGYHYHGVDISEEAVRQAREQTHKATVPATIWQADIMVEPPKRQFNTVFDKGCMHTFLQEDDRQRFCQTVYDLLEPDGVWVHISGSMDNRDKKNAEEFGYPRLSALEIVRIVEPQFMIHYMARCRYGTTKGLTNFLGWACVFQKR